MNFQLFDVMRAGAVPGAGHRIMVPSGSPTEFRGVNSYERRRQRRIEWLCHDREEHSESELLPSVIAEFHSSEVQVYAISMVQRRKESPPYRATEGIKESHLSPRKTKF